MKKQVSNITGAKSVIMPGGRPRKKRRPRNGLGKFVRQSPSPPPDNVPPPSSSSSSSLSSSLPPTPSSSSIAQPTFQTPGRVVLDNDESAGRSAYVSPRFDNAIPRYTYAELKKKLENQQKETPKRKRRDSRTRFDDEVFISPVGMRRGGLELKGIKGPENRTSKPLGRLPHLTLSQLNEIHKTLNHETWDIAGVSGHLYEVVVRDKNDEYYNTGIFLAKKIWSPCVHAQLDASALHCSGRHDCNHCQCGCGKFRNECGTPKGRTWTSDIKLRDVVANVVAGTTRSKGNIFAQIRGIPLEGGKPNTHLRLLRTFVYPALVRMMHRSIMSAILEYKVNYMKTHKDAKKPFPVGFCADGRWSKSYV